MTAGDPVATLAEELRLLRVFLLDAGDPSFAATIEQVAPKVLLLAAASAFEERLTTIVQDFVDATTTSGALSSMVRRYVISRQYHKWFDWERRKIGPFLALFGDVCGGRLRVAAASDELHAAVEAFLEIGALRNQLVHRNYALFVLEKTIDEVFALYVLGSTFVNALPELLARSDSDRPSGVVALSIDN